MVKAKNVRSPDADTKGPTMVRCERPNHLYMSNLYQLKTFATVGDVTFSTPRQHGHLYTPRANTDFRGKPLAATGPKLLEQGLS